MKCYRGMRRNGQCVVWIQRGGRRCEELSPRFDVRNHSPDGFNWGYCGSGPAQLALAILLDATGQKELTERLYQDFKREVIAGLDRDNWFITQEVVHEWVMACVTIDMMENPIDHTSEGSGC